MNKMEWLNRTEKSSLGSGYNTIIVSTCDHSNDIVYVLFAMDQMCSVNLRISGFDLFFKSSFGEFTIFLTPILNRTMIGGKNTWIYILWPTDVTDTIRTIARIDTTSRKCMVLLFGHTNSI